MLRIIYEFIYTLLFIPIFILTTLKRKYPLSLKERFVIYNTKQKDVYWFHCASVGELKVIEPLIKHYQKKNKKLLITIFSPRGLSHAKAKFPDIEVKALPFDLSYLIKRFIKIFSPKALFIVEEEFWFNLATITNKHNIPIISVNSRLSDNSVKKYKKFRFFYKKIFDSFTKYLIRSEYDLKLFSELVNKDKLILCGDLKFLSSVSSKNVELKIERSPILVLGSTHEPEEKIFLDILPELKKSFPNIALIIAPRHLERVKDIKTEIKNRGFSYRKRSDGNIVDRDIYILDTLGELNSVYKYADLVFVGGTIANVGGHNILEPACLGKKIIIGKNYYKIKANVSLLNKLRILEIVDLENLSQKIVEILNNKERKDIKKILKKISIKTAKCYLKNLNEFINSNSQQS